MTIINQQVAQMILGAVQADPNISLSKLYKNYEGMKLKGRRASFKSFSDTYGFLLPQAVEASESATATDEVPELPVGTKFVYQGKRKGTSTWVVTGHDGSATLAVRETDATKSGAPRKGVSPNKWNNLAENIAKGFTRKGEDSPVYSLA